MFLNLLVSPAQSKSGLQNDDYLKRLLNHLKLNIRNSLTQKNLYLAACEKLENNEIFEHLKVNRMPKNTVLNQNFLYKWKSIEKESNLKFMEILRDHHLSESKKYKEKYRSLILEIVEFKSKRHACSKHFALELMRNYVKIIQKNVKYENSTDKNEKLNRKASYKLSEELVYERILRTSVCMTLVNMRIV